MYRENIGEFVKEKDARLYLPKNGGLYEHVRNLLPEIGLDKSTGRVTKGNEQIGKLEIKLTRGEDIPQRVIDNINKGIPAYGLTGDDLLDEFLLRSQANGGKESPLKKLNTYDWFDPNAEFFRPSLCLMNSTGTWEGFGNNTDIAVNSKYLLTSTKYLTERFGQKGISYKTSVYIGDTEDTVAEGTNAGCIEIVYRGNKSEASAKSRNKLKIVENLRFTDIVLIGAKE